MSEREVENRVELPSKEEIERVSYCVGTYLSAFSKEPFDEKWSINGEKSSAFLLNPKTAGEFVNEVFQQDALEVFKTPEGGESIKVEREKVSKYIGKTLDCPMTEHLLATGWFTSNDMEEFSKLRENVDESNEEFLTIHAPFPVTKILKSYVETIRTPKSLVILGYQNENGFNSGGKMEFLHIKEGGQHIENVYPRLVGRYKTINHPEIVEDVSKLEDSRKIVLDEIDNYFSEEETKLIADSIDPDIYTCYLGEIAKIDEFKKNLSAIIFTGGEYLKVLTSELGNRIDYEATHLAPEQIVYLSFEGTNVAESNKSKTSESKLFTMLKRPLGRFGVQFKEKVLSFPRPNGQKVVVGIIKKN